MATDPFERLEHRRCFDGWYNVIRHQSETCNAPMTFAIYVPDVATTRPCPWLMWLSGLTCTHENFMVKAGAQRIASQLGIVLVAPDTSPRKTGIPNEAKEGELGEGASFYINATQDPWRKHYQMFDYVNKELPKFVEAHFPVEADRCGIFGHSMGGHGALISYFRQERTWLSCSALAPVCRPTLSPWGRQALQTYLGSDEQKWENYDASHLVTVTKTAGQILIDQGMSDPFLSERLRLDELVNAAASVNYPLDVRRRPNYDHSYFYVSTFIGEHLDFHSRRL